MEIGSDFNLKIKEEKNLFFVSGRCAIKNILNNLIKNNKKFLIPNYLCDSIFNCFKNYDFYNIDNNLNINQEDKTGKQLYINPDVCIDCGACLPECPVDAIHPTEELAIKYGELEYVIKNYDFYGQTYKPRT